MTHRALLPVLILKQAVLLIMHLGVIWLFYRDYGYANSLIELGTVESGIEKLAAFDNVSLSNWNSCPKKTELA